MNPSGLSEKIQFWRWPNILGVDAAFIAVAWLGAYANVIEKRLTVSAYLVLFLSVWLTYAADRLFDVRKLRIDHQLTSRHRWTQRHSHKLWKIWWFLLALNLALATQLQKEQLSMGIVLLVATLAYTALNQTLSRRFFPKEVFVAVIFAGGIVVFLPGQVDCLFFSALTGLCLLNCLSIGLKEAKIDQYFGQKSAVLFITSARLRIATLIGFLICGVIQFPLHSAIAIGLLGLGTLQLLDRRIKIESYRVLADAILLICLAASFASP